MAYFADVENFDAEVEKVAVAVGVGRVDLSHVDKIESSQVDLLLLLLLVVFAYDCQFDVKRRLDLIVLDFGRWRLNQHRYQDIDFFSNGRQKLHTIVN